MQYKEGKLFFISTIFIIMGIISNAYAENLDKRDIFDRIINNQNNKKRFSIKATVNKTLRVEGESGGMAILGESSIDVDLEHNILHAKNNLKITFLDKSDKAESFPSSIEYYLIGNDLVFFHGSRSKWVKYNCKFCYFDKYAPTYWKAIELIRAGGFFDYKVKHKFNPSLEDMIEHGLAGADKVDPSFPAIYDILFNGFSYTVLDMKEIIFRNMRCYQFNIQVSEEALNRYKGPEDTNLYKVSMFTVNVVALKDSDLLLALRYKLEAKDREQWFTGDADFNISGNGEFIYDYPQVPLELPIDVKNAEDYEKKLVSR